jgi:hypothetical protein
MQIPNKNSTTQIIEKKETVADFIKTDNFNRMPQALKTQILNIQPQVKMETLLNNYNRDLRTLKDSTLPKGLVIKGPLYNPCLFINLCCYYANLKTGKTLCDCSYPRSIKSYFINQHPCGVAISKQGKVAVCTFEGDRQDGKVYIWNCYNSFSTNKMYDYGYTINQPEAVAFDNNEALFIASPLNGIYYTTNIAQAPTANFSIVVNNNSSPRGMAFNAANEMFVMCENVKAGQVKPSIVVKITNPTSNNRTQAEIQGTTQSASNALGVTVLGNNLFTTDLNGNSINKYNVTGSNSVNKINTLPGADLTMDLVTDGNYIYFTNLKGNNCNLVKWDLNDKSGDPTTHINKGMGITAPCPNCDGYDYTVWGLALYGSDLIVCDAPRNQIRIFDKATAAWVK